jgi:hypothetical protein
LQEKMQKIRRSEAKPNRAKIRSGLMAKKIIAL